MSTNRPETPEGWTIVRPPDATRTVTTAAGNKVLLEPGDSLEIVQLPPRPVLCGGCGRERELQPDPYGGLPVCAACVLRWASEDSASRAEPFCCRWHSGGGAPGPCLIASPAELNAGRATRSEIPLLSEWFDNARNESLERHWGYSNGASRTAAYVDVVTLKVWAATPDMTIALDLGKVESVDDGKQRADEWLSSRATSDNTQLSDVATAAPGPSTSERAVDVFAYAEAEHGAYRAAALKIDHLKRDLTRARLIGEAYRQLLPLAVEACAQLTMIEHEHGTGTSDASAQLTAWLNNDDFIVRLDQLPPPSDEDDPVRAAEQLQKLAEQDSER